MGFGYDLFEGMFFLAFFLVIVIFVVTLGKCICQWNKNRNAPRLTVEATVVSKRADVSWHSSGGQMQHQTSSTSYYVTFQVDSGDRLELQLRGKEYGLLEEGDRGKLSFQGTRYLGFERT